MPQVMLVDDNRPLAGAVAAALRREGMSVDVFYDGRVAEEVLAQRVPTVLMVEALLPGIFERFGSENLLVDHSAKDPHRLSESRVLVKHHNGSLQPMAEASDFIAHMSRIDCYRVYAERSVREQVAAELECLWRSSRSRPG